MPRVSVTSSIEKDYEFGNLFRLDLTRTVTNAVPKLIGFRSIGGGLWKFWGGLIQFEIAEGSFTLYKNTEYTGGTLIIPSRVNHLTGGIPSAEVREDVTATPLAANIIFRAEFISSAGFLQVQAGAQAIPIIAAEPDIDYVVEIINNDAGQGREVSVNLTYSFPTI